MTLTCGTYRRAKLGWKGSLESLEEKVGHQEEWVVGKPAGQGWRYGKDWGFKSSILTEGKEKAGKTDG